MSAAIKTARLRLYLSAKIPKKGAPTNAKTCVIPVNVEKSRVAGAHMSFTVHSFKSKKSFVTQGGMNDVLAMLSERAFHESMMNVLREILPDTLTRWLD